MARAAAGRPRRLLAYMFAGQHLAAATRLGRPSTRSERTGRAGREVVTAAEGAGLLVLARDGDRTRLGPQPRTGQPLHCRPRPCPVLLVWPGPAPGVATIPPPPPPPTAPPAAPGMARVRTGIQARPGLAVLPQQPLDQGRVAEPREVTAGGGGGDDDGARDVAGAWGAAREHEHTLDVQRGLLC
jgi:hypothetical protein